MYNARTADHKYQHFYSLILRHIGVNAQPGKVQPASVNPQCHIQQRQQHHRAASLTQMKPRTDRRLQSGSFQYCRRGRLG